MLPFLLKATLQLQQQLLILAMKLISLSFFILRVCVNKVKISSLAKESFQQSVSIKILLARDIRDCENDSSDSGTKETAQG